MGAGFTVADLPTLPAGCILHFLCSWFSFQLLHAVQMLCAKLVEKLRCQKLRILIKNFCLSRMSVCAGRNCTDTSPAGSKRGRLIMTGVVVYPNAGEVWSLCLQSRWRTLVSTLEPVEKPACSHQ